MSDDYLREYRDAFDPPRPARVPRLGRREPLGFPKLPKPGAVIWWPPGGATGPTGDQEPGQVPEVAPGPDRASAGRTAAEEGQRLAQVAKACGLTLDEAVQRIKGDQ